MSKHNVIDLADREKVFDPLSDLLRAGAQQLIQKAVESELQSLLEEHVDRRT